MNGFSEQIKSELIKAGADLVGFADLGEVPEHLRSGYRYGISIAAAITPEIVNGIGTGPNKAYYDEYCRLNQLLENLDLTAAELLKGRGFNALPLTKANVKINYSTRSALLPHKTVATRAGLGWIGKCALLVTEKYGSAIRISSVLTDAPLETDAPISCSRCGDCGNCVRNCPGEALSGELWSAGMERDSLYDMQACRNIAIKRTWKVIPGDTHCGLCILVCPWTRKYIRGSGLDYGFPSVDIAEKGDLAEILELQKLAYRSEAEIYGDFTIQPLIQSLDDLQKEAEGSILLKVVEDRRIIGSVRAYEKEEVCYIGKLIVHPEYQNRGVGKKLLASIERCFKGARYQLFTGYRSEKNLALYEKMGYVRTRTVVISDKFQMVYLEK